MSAFGLTAVASALLLVSSVAVQASPRSDPATAAPRTSAAAAAAPAAPTSAAKPAPRVIDPPVGDPATVGSTPAPAKAEAAPAARPPSLADVVERIDRILREGAPTQQPRSSVRPARDNARKAAASRRPSGPAADRPTRRDLTLFWPVVQPQGSTGFQVRWPADLDPRRQPPRPLGVRLSWPASDGPR